MFKSQIIQKMGNSNSFNTNCIVPNCLLPSAWKKVPFLFSRTVSLVNFSLKCFNTNKKNFILLCRIANKAKTMSLSVTYLGIVTNFCLNNIFCGSTNVIVVKQPKRNLRKEKKCPTWVVVSGTVSCNKIRKAVRGPTVERNGRPPNGLRNFLFLS